MQTRELNKFSAKNEIESCLLCHDAPCTRKCTHGLNPAGIIRSMRFENTGSVAELTHYGDTCRTCDNENCIKACTKGKIDRAVRIPQLMEYAGKQTPSSKKKSDLSITFCGVACENPFFLSSSIVASEYDMVARAFDMGWSGAVFKTIGTFVPKEVSPRFSGLRKEGNSFIGFKNIEQISDHTLEENLDVMHRLKVNYPNKVIVASILGQDDDEWTYLARRVTEAGVDIIECNFSCPHMSGEGLGSDVGQNPDLVARYTKATRKGTHLPILAKMTPNIGNMEIPAIAAMENGATGIAAINTIKSIMNVHLENFASEPAVDGKSCVGGYSGKTVKPIALRFIHDMKKHSKLRDVPMSGMGGIETWRDAAEFIAMGCENIQITTAVMQYGYRIIDDLIEGFSSYLADNGFTSVSEMVGIALPNVVSADHLNRQSISFPNFDKAKCIACGRCYISCMDGGHQALKMSGTDKKPKLQASKCVGCHLCVVVCPVGAISPGKRVSSEKNA